MKIAICSILAAALMLVPAAAGAQQQTRGTWFISPAQDSSQVRFELRIVDSNGHDDSTQDVALSDLNLTRSQLDSSGTHATFSLRRDAGTFACDGWLQGGNGTGQFVFTSNPQYTAQLQRRGYTIDEPRKIVTAAIIDLSVPYIDSINAAGFGKLSFEKLVTFRALRIDPGYIADMRSHFPGVDADKIVSLRALNVTDAYISDVRSMGLAVPTAEDAVELRALHIDGAYVREMASVGYSHLSAHDLVEMRALGIDAAFVRRAQAHGFHNLSVQQLVQAKAMGVL